jgi:hypothetical protein
MNEEFQQAVRAEDLESIRSADRMQRPGNENFRAIIATPSSQIFHYPLDCQFDKTLQSG